MAWDDGFRKDPNNPDADYEVWSPPVEREVVPDELAHLIAEALEGPCAGGVVVGEEERTVIRETIQNYLN